MKRSIGTIAALIVLTAFIVGAEEADVVYVEGKVDIKTRGGELFEAFIGDYVQTGDTVITGKDGLVQLSNADDSVITVRPGTVFTLLERGSGDRKSTVLSTTLGSVRFKFGRVLGTEPDIATPSLVAGVRGTEFEVFAGADGTSLITVESGLVVVRSAGVTVELSPDEGVEVRPGEAPGEKFPVRRGSLDYSQWNGRLEEEFVLDPVAAVRRAVRGMQSLAGQLDAVVPVYEESRKRLEELRSKLDSMDPEEQKAERKKLYDESVFPLEIETSYLRLNIRYFALSSLSYRRFILGRMYTYMRSAYAVDRSNEVYAEFLAEYRAAIELYESRVAPYLVEADI